MTPSSKKAENTVLMPLNGKAPLEQVVRQGLTDGVLATLRKAIVAGAFAPGDHVPETRMAEQLGVSRVPVREAMMTLEREGLLEFDERGAARVRNFTATDFEEIFTMRLALEPMAARLACRRLQSVDVAALTDNIRRMRKTTSLLEVTLLDVDFHDLIMQSARHGLLSVCWGNLRSLLRVWLARLHRLEEGTKETKQLTMKGHVQIVKILQSGDSEAAAKAMRHHLVSWRERMPKTTWEGNVS
ncbi:MAG: GntR family transcriptional regulator [Pedosphaera sp.]|nr:GntR family transcriptional regulator [Pedosphaera sp.]